MTDIVERLHYWHGRLDGLSLYAEAADEIERLRAALASKSSHAIDASAGCVEPVAWMYDIEMDGELFTDWTTTDKEEAHDEMHHNVRPLFVAPQQRQPMTVDEIILAAGHLGATQMLVKVARAVEQAQGIGEAK
jgi:hypothetical protein